MSQQNQIGEQLRSALREFRFVELTPEVKAEIHRRVYSIIGKLFEYEIIFHNYDITRPDEITINITGEIKHDTDKSQTDL